MEDPGLSGEEWERVMGQSVSQSLLPLVFEAVYPFLPEELEQKYRAASLSWIMKQVQASDEFLRTYRALVEKGLEPLVIKGIVCRSAYELPDWRVSGDEDIYIGQEEYPRLHACLKQLGFACREPNFRSEHELPYTGKNLLLEGHWKLFPQENRAWDEMNDAMAREIMQRAVRRKIEGVSLLTPDPTDHMVYLLLHAMKHFALSGMGIRQICDVVCWAGKNAVDWDRVRDAMTGLGGLTFAQAVLDAGNRYFEMPFPEGWERTDSTDLIGDALSGGVFGHSSADRVHSASITLADSASGHHMSLNILRAVFPSRTVMEINYPWVSKSSLLLPVGWGVRLVRYAARTGRKESPLRSIRIGAKRADLMRKYGIFEK